MNTNDLNTALYEKMAAEQDKYRDWLKSQPPEEILNHTYEYTIREDIVMAMEELELTDAQAKALLESPSPLADVYRYFEKLETGYMDVIRNYGMERVALVLANTVQLQDWDGRYSRRNKEWAKTIPNENPETVRCGYVLNSHPAVLDGFIDLVREEQQRSRTQGEKTQPSRPSVRDKLKQELPVHKPAAPKKREPER